MKNIITATMLLGIFLIAGCTSTHTTGGVATSSVKEFYMDSFYTIEDGKPHPQFSLKEINVKKGDIVRIHINVTKGMHDFVIEELNVSAETPTGNVTTIEFIAGKSGEFIYFCSMPGHRDNGQWGTLKVIE